MSAQVPGAEDFSGKRVAVVGMGKSGRACVKVLRSLTSAEVSAWDSREAAVEGISGTTGYAEDAADLASAVVAWKPDIVIPAPAITELGPLFESCRESGAEIMSEIELAWRLRAHVDGVAAPWLCITGTNGKTTTTTMSAAILSAAGMNGRAIGNVGNPAVTEVSRTDEDAAGAFAVELSSFQLTTTSTMSPVGSICLNIADDHLEWHGTRERYWAAKSKVYEHTQVACLYPVGDSSVQRMVDEADVIEGARAIGLTLGIPSVGQVGLVDEFVVDRAFGASRHTEGVVLFEVADIEHLAPAGQDLPLHIMKDAMAAAALARSAGVSPEAIRGGLRGFDAGRHRIELIASVDGINYVNDSKATNAHAARASLGALTDGTAVWIVGGLAKGSRFEELVAGLKHKLRGVVVIGVDQEPWREALAAVEVPVRYIDPDAEAPMESAVAAARTLAVTGDTVLLAPACASMDQFTSYAQRGDAFADAVRRLRG